MLKQGRMLPKEDFPPILRAGIHRMTMETVRETFVSSMPEASRRVQLFSHLDHWVARLRQLNVTGTLWLDGSFVTRKPEPCDLDCVLWNPSFVGPITDEGKVELLAMIDHAKARAAFGIDLYVAVHSPNEQMKHEAYWRGLFGFQHDGRSAKGFVELMI